MSNEKKAPGRFWRGRERHERGEGYHLEAPEAPLMHAITPRVLPPDAELYHPPQRTKREERREERMAEKAARKAQELRRQHIVDELRRQHLFKIIPQTVPAPVRRVTLASKCPDCGTMFSWEADKVNDQGLFEFREGADQCTHCGKEAEEVQSLSPERMRRQREHDTTTPFPTGAPPAREPLEPMQPPADQETDL